MNTPVHDAGPSPVNRRKTGSKHHLICDGKGTPFKVITTTADVSDVTQTLALVDGIPPVAGKPGRPRRRPDALLGDKGYDSNPNRRELRRRRRLPGSAEQRSTFPRFPLPPQACHLVPRRALRPGNRSAFIGRDV